ncbi:hypothetical protein B7P43_G09675 [Cryptotermes secundus]|uniref:Uncharacterized protein n=1 Tax=Cryptotermes secundus TaxID=105785 RepID=A0A2J7Q746_9NEOP|nr:hypothetical protein B7P43_G09675 [Cryptotermes secundus]
MMIFCINISFICIRQDFGKVVWKDRTFIPYISPCTYVQNGRLRICHKSFGRSVGLGRDNATRTISHCERSDSGLA